MGHSAARKSTSSLSDSNLNVTPPNVAASPSNTIMELALAQEKSCAIDVRICLARTIAVERLDFSTSREVQMLVHQACTTQQKLLDAELAS